ncbi:hypothetical protein WICPIJ_008764 [Wickerhamomyces pijperi]|uniref:Uncharacterized protein n=1 Tax=Wickerhamomyces pijperi TaxID=599730 RepID=A0A9P8THV3_WICPI|nr:hypothetical protein WICPIJ_008764 [Wickerhamomyces pijperi]
MAPPTPILSKDEILRAYKLDKMLKSPDNNCTLKSLTQFECSFDNGLYKCNPFKRIFQDCILSNGKRQVVEMTTSETNEDDSLIDKRRFMDVQADLKRIYEEVQNGASS